MSTTSYKMCKCIGNGIKTLLEQSNPTVKYHEAIPNENEHTVGMPQYRIFYVICHG